MVRAVPIHGDIQKTVRTLSASLDKTHYLTKDRLKINVPYPRFRTTCPSLVNVRLPATRGPLVRRHGTTTHLHVPITFGTTKSNDYKIANRLWKNTAPVIPSQPPLNLHLTPLTRVGLPKPWTKNSSYLILNGPTTNILIRSTRIKTIRKIITSTLTVTVVVITLFTTFSPFVPSLLPKFLLSLVLKLCSELLLSLQSSLQLQESFVRPLDLRKELAVSSRPFEVVLSFFVTSASNRSTRTYP